MDEDSVPTGILLSPFCDFAKILLLSCPVCFLEELMSSPQGLVKSLVKEQTIKRRKRNRRLNCDTQRLGTCVGEAATLCPGTPGKGREGKKEGPSVH